MVCVYLNLHVESRVKFHNENQYEYLCTDVVFFRKWLGRYRLEHVQAKACPTEKDLGLILVDTNQLKAQLLPSPVKCLEVLLLHEIFQGTMYMCVVNSPSGHS